MNAHAALPSLLARNFREWSVGFALFVLLGILGLFAPQFFNAHALLSLGAGQSPALVVAIGAALVMICRQIDISVGSQFCVCAVVGGLAAAKGYPLAMVIPCTALLGGAMGAINGFFVAVLRLPSIVVTLATMVTWAEVLRLFQQGKMVSLPPGMQWFGWTQQAGQVAVIATAVALVGVAAWFLRNVNVGRFLYAVGSDAESARLAGVNPQRTTFGVFVLMGALVGIAASLQIVQSPQVQPTVGVGLELKAIAAAVVGGVAVNGGRGNLWGVFVGFVLLVVINPALAYLGVEAYWEKAVYGAVILLAVLADGLRTRRARG
jgi:rhamnose transport system permease protein